MFDLEDCVSARAGGGHPARRSGFRVRVESEPPRPRRAESEAAESVDVVHVLALRSLWRRDRPLTTPRPDRVPYRSDDGLPAVAVRCNTWVRTS